MSDERFKALATDPRYRLPSRKQAQTAVDPRFGRLFTDDAFQRKANVDRYGRKVKHDTGKRDIQRRFRLEDDEPPSAGKEQDEQNDRIAPGSSDDESDEAELLDSQTRDPAREGFSGSSSEEEASSDEESEDAEALAEETAGNELSEEVPMGEVTRRIAVVNLDWDHIRASDIMAVAQSFAPAGGRILNTVVYPSEFGMERMAREELEGPPKEIFASSGKGKYEDDQDDSQDSDEEDEETRIRKRLLDSQAKDGEEFDTAKLRQYQLDRLRYYYAVIECDTEATAKALYDNMDSREYLTTANFFDLRFIPPETTFDTDPREECQRLPDGYKPNDFRTEALTHSKVKLTWDDDDTTRKEVQKRAFSRAEIDENDLQAYIGSDSSDADSTTSRKSAAAGRKLKKKEAAKLQMRALLGLPETATKRSATSDEPVGDMQITFSTGLSAKQNKGVFENEPQDEASTRERYIRKERERKQKRKEKLKAGKGDAAADAETVETGEGEDDADPFDDPFFNDPATAAKAEVAARKAEKQKKRDAKIAEDEAAAGRRAELELLMAEDDNDAVRHFDMKEVEKAEKNARKKGKKQKQRNGKSENSADLDDFKIQTTDPRFQQLFESHDYAIDPTNPRYKGTKGMKDLLEEGRKKRKTKEASDDETTHVHKKSKKHGKTSGEHANSENITGLIARLKTKAPK